MLLIDTHVLIWLDEGSCKLGANARRQLDDAYQKGQLAICSISFWETAMLVEKKRLSMKLNLTNWRADLLNKGLEEISLRGDVAIAAANLPDFHGDPADRIIAATALHLAIPLMTADKKILHWTQLKTINATI